MESKMDGELRKKVKFISEAQNADEHAKRLHHLGPWDACARSLGCDFTPRPCESTTAWPGTAEKIAVLAARYEAGEEMHHDDDPRRGPGAVQHEGHEVSISELNAAWQNGVTR